MSIEAGPGNLNGFLIDGSPWQHGCTNHLLQRGDLVEWTVSNTSPIPHPFHIHTNAFQVIAAPGQDLDTPVWRDVIEVPGNGSVTFRMRIDDFVGEIVLHCHLIDHEDLGMMQNVTIVDDTIPPGDVVSDPGIDPDDPSTKNPAVPGYYVSENFTLCE